MGHIRKRAGLANPLLTVTGGTIPSNGSAVACTFDLSFLIHTSTDVVTQVSVGQHRCAVRYLFASNSYTIAALDSPSADIHVVTERTEERRVGKECVRPTSSRWWPYQ